MNNTDKAKVRKLMEKMRTGISLNNPQSSPLLFGLGSIARGLDRLSMRMQQYASDNNIQGLSDPDAFNKAVLGAQIGMRMANLGGARLMETFIREHYQYVVHPAIRSLGKAGGKYGHILENYIKTKSDVKKSWGDIGANIGTGIGIGVGFLTKGLRLAGLSAAATGVGIPVAAITIGVSIAIDLIVGAALTLAGRKIGEFVAEAGGFTEKYSKPTLGQDVMNTIPEAINHYRSVISSVVTQPWYKPEAGYDSYFNTMQSLARKDTMGISNQDLGVTTREFGALYDAVGKNLFINNKDRGYYTRTLGVLKGITGEDFMSTFAGISRGSALSKTQVSSTEVNKTADAFLVFFNAVSRGARETNTAALNLTKSLALAADAYSKRNITAKDTDILFAGVQKYVQKTMQPSGGEQQDTTEATSLIDIMDKVTKSSFETPLATELTQYAGIDRVDAQLGLNSEKFENMTKAFSTAYNFGEGSKMENGRMKLDENGKGTFAQLYLDATRAKEQGGLGLSSDEATKLAKHILAYQTNPKAMKFGGKVSNPLEDKAKEIKAESIFDITRTQTKITDSYESLSGKFAPSFIDLSQNILGYSAKITWDIAKGALDLLAVAKGLTEGTSDWEEYLIPAAGYENSSSDPSGGSGGYSGPIVTPTTTTGKVYVGKDLLIAPDTFVDEISGAAKAAGIELRTLYAFFGAESVFGANQKNYKGLDYVGVGQIGQEAQDHMNRLKGTNLNRFRRSDNILLAAYYADYLRDRYVAMKKNKNSPLYGLNFDPNDPRVIYIAYNWGMGNLDKHIIRNGGINWESLPKETQIGVGNVERALAGFDASQQPGLSVPSGNVKDTSDLIYNKKYNGGLIRGVNSGSRRVYTAALFAMSGNESVIGNKIANRMEELLRTDGKGAEHLRGRRNNFYEMCAAIAGFALEQSGYGRDLRAKGDAEVQLREWVQKNMALTPEEVARTGGLQPGDLVYAVGGNHVGVVTFDGSVIQAGRAIDENDALVRTDATTFTYTRSGFMVIRVSGDVNLDGRMSADERRKLLATKAKPFTPPKLTKTPNGATFPSGVIKKSVTGKEVLVNAVVNKTSGGTFTVKNSRGAGLSKVQIAKIKRQEAALEKALGLDADELTLSTKTTSSGANFLDVKINVSLEDVGKVTQDLIRAIERII